MISPTARYRFARSRTDLTTVASCVLICMALYLGLAVLTGSHATALAGAAGLGLALVLTVKMMALPHGPRSA
ncbi:hypothetical protein ACWDYH_38850 [Nocardia goodfellowii]